MCVYKMAWDVENQSVSVARSSPDAKEHADDVYSRSNARECGSVARANNGNDEKLNAESVDQVHADAFGDWHQSFGKSTPPTSIETTQDFQNNSARVKGSDKPVELANGILAGIGLTPQEPMLGKDGKLQCALIWCPEVPKGTQFALLHRNESGEAIQLDVGMLEDLAPSLNLARLRQRGAQLGANEVVLILPQDCAPIA